MKMKKRKKDKGKKTAAKGKAKSKAKAKAKSKASAKPSAKPEAKKKSEDLRSKADKWRKGLNPDGEEGLVTTLGINLCRTCFENISK